MSKKFRPYILTIAGLDPTGGAGILADIKTFEQHKTYGMAVCTANTLQTEHHFSEIHWTDTEIVLRSIRTLLDTYPIKAIKIGIIPSLDFLQEILNEIHKKNSDIPIIWDTVLRSTTKHEFLSVKDQALFFSLLEKVSLITPNREELFSLSGESNPRIAIQNLSKHCHVLLKGGHHPIEKGADYLYDMKGNEYRFGANTLSEFDKRGTGCVLSASITANLALGIPLDKACIKAKKYIEAFLNSNKTLLGYHVT